MSKCKWCGKVEQSLHSVIDAFGNKSDVCSNCFDSFSHNECRRCGNTSAELIDGLCLNCFQIKLNEKQKRREEVISGVDEVSYGESDLEFTDEDYDAWMTMGKTFSPNDMKNSTLLRRLWIMVKLSATGIEDPEIINSHMDDIEKLIDRAFSRLINNKCKLIIARDRESRRLAQQKLIDYENDVFIIQG